MRVATRADQRRETRSPWCQRLMRRRQFRENGEILARTELIAQALRFLRPHLPQARPERLYEIHLVTVLDNTAPQIVQMLCLGIGPGIRHELSCAPNSFARH